MFLRILQLAYAEKALSRPVKKTHACILFTGKEEGKNATRTHDRPVDCRDLRGRQRILLIAKKKRNWCILPLAITLQVGQTTAKTPEHRDLELPVTTFQHLGTVSRCHGMVMW
jgi:hypothetical protein